jgi:hypothetical protein
MPADLITLAHFSVSTGLRIARAASLFTQFSLRCLCCRGYSIRRKARSFRERLRAMASATRNFTSQSPRFLLVWVMARAPCVRVATSQGAAAGRTNPRASLCAGWLAFLLGHGRALPWATCRKSSGTGVGNSSVILAPDVLASVIGHERGCDQAEHRANPDVDGDRI